MGERELTRKQIGEPRSFSYSDKGASSDSAITAKEPFDMSKAPKRPEQPTREAAGAAAGGKGELLPSLLFNWLSLAGIMLVSVIIVSSIFFFLLDLVSDDSPAYLGMVYAVFLPLLLAGAIAVPIGMVREKRRRDRGEIRGEVSVWVIDLRKPSHRNAVLGILVGGVFISLIMATGSYKAYQATESNIFCGQVCHRVMHPEATAYQYSSHARVKCVECHIGSGAGWFVRSKLSGVAQVVAVIANTYPRPIPTPIHDLRPARETCEECHWPSRFIGYREMIRTYFLTDERNTPFRVRMLMKIGGEKSKLAVGSGIHYHMLIASRVEYIARDDKRQEIAWVRIHRADGSVTEFDNTDEPLSEEEKASREVRVMDCMDCHNRPSHQFPVPMKAVNTSIEQGLISSDLPFIKLEATKALDSDFETTEQAMAGVANHLRNFYAKKYPEVVQQRAGELQRTIEEVQNIYRRSNFPEMKANWSAYPDNIGHRDWAGCFRCHNENMESKEGFTIFTTCDKCHLILAQGGDIEEAQVNFTRGLRFLHPEDKSYVEEYTQCTDCHTGGAEVYD
jgi:hypothetical protein